MTGDELFPPRETLGQTRRILLVIDVLLYKLFHGLLQEGFFLEVPLGQSVKDLLSRFIGLPETYVEERISTIFLNGKPVDNIDSAIITDRSVLALSSAMPGLVGATMRRRGFYAALRSSITYQGEAWQGGQEEGFIKVKLFNLLLRDAGPTFLRRGIVLPAGRFSQHWASWQSHSGEGLIRETFLDGTPLGTWPPDLAEKLLPANWVRLTVEAAGN
jgi:hypothetical protein